MGVSAERSGRVATDPAPKLGHIGEDVGLAPQFVGDHGGLTDIEETTVTRTPRRCTVHQRAEIAIAGKQHNLIDMFGEFHRIDRKLDIHVALDLAAAAASMNSLVALVTTV